LSGNKRERITEVLWPRVLDGDLRAIDRVLRTRESYRRLTGLDLERERESGGPAFIVTSLEYAMRAAGVPDVVDANWTPADHQAGEKTASLAASRPKSCTKAMQLRRPDPLRTLVGTTTPRGAAAFEARDTRQPAWPRPPPG